MSVRSISLLAAAVAFALAGSPRASTIYFDPNLPVLSVGAAYLYPSSQPDFTGLGLRVTFYGVEDRASGPVNRVPSGPNEIETYSSLFAGSVSVNLGPFVAMTATGSEDLLVFNKLGNATGTFNTELLAMNLSGSSCRHYVNSAAACDQAQIGTDAVYARRQCEFVNPTDKLARRSCILAADAAAVNDRITMRTERQSAVITCDTWGMTCENSVGCQ